jgi:Zn-dependent M28 family amino/carboxypeptidase
MAHEAGAVGFLIAGPVPGACVAGSSGRDGADGIPAVGIAPETAARLARTRAGWPRVTLTIDTEEGPAATQTLLFDIPGRTDEWVVLSAHVDGHDLAESAIDNATGVAAALAVTRAVARHIAPLKRGLRLAFFSVEEWALIGSAQYVAGLSARERDAIALNVNLDSVAGGVALTAMTSGFAGLEPFLIEVAAANGRALRCVRPLMMNSDHGNFATAGIPAFRLVAGYDDPRANARYVLTPADTRDKVARAELAAAAELSAAVIMAACDAAEAETRAWRLRPFVS